MSLQLSQIDEQGRIQLPAQVQKVTGLQPKTDILIECKEGGIFIKPKKTEAPITQKLSEMNLPIADWKEIKQEIENGHLE